MALPTSASILYNVRVAPPHSPTPAQSDAPAAVETRTQHCEGCGANTVVPVHLVSTSCTYCESPLVETEVAAATIDTVVAFTVSAEAAAEKVKAWLHGQRWAPGEVRRLGQDPRALRAIYVPHGVYGGEVRARYNARIGIQYTKTVKRGDKKEVVTKTDWHTLRGTYGRNFEHHLVSASQGLPEQVSNQLEPYDLGTQRPFDPRLVAGIEAELPTHGTDLTDHVLVDELKRVTEREIAGGFLPGDRHELRELTVTASIHDRAIVALPVWMGNFHHKGEVHHCFVNGQTGQVVGTAPRSWLKISLTVLAITALVVVGWFVWRGM